MDPTVKPTSISPIGSQRNPLPSEPKPSCDHLSGMFFEWGGFSLHGNTLPPKEKEIEDEPKQNDPETKKYQDKAPLLSRSVEVIKSRLERQKELIGDLANTCSDPTSKPVDILKVWQRYYDFFGQRSHIKSESEVLSALFIHTLSGVDGADGALLEFLNHSKIKSNIQRNPNWLSERLTADIGNIYFSTIDDFLQKHKNDEKWNRVTTVLSKEKEKVINRIKTIIKIYPNRNQNKEALTQEICQLLKSHQIYHISIWKSVMGFQDNKMAIKTALELGENHPNFLVQLLRQLNYIDVGAILLSEDADRWIKGVMLWISNKKQNPTNVETFVLDFMKNLERILSSYQKGGRVSASKEALSLYHIFLKVQTEIVCNCPFILKNSDVTEAVLKCVRQIPITAITEPRVVEKYKELIFIYALSEEYNVEFIKIFVQMIASSKNCEDHRDALERILQKHGKNKEIADAFLENAKTENSVIWSVRFYLKALENFTWNQKQEKIDTQTKILNCLINHKINDRELWRHFIQRGLNSSLIPQFAKTLVSSKKIDPDLFGFLLNEFDGTHLVEIMTHPDLGSIFGKYLASNTQFQHAYSEWVKKCIASINEKSKEKNSKKAELRLHALNLIKNHEVVLKYIKGDLRTKYVENQFATLNCYMTLMKDTHLSKDASTLCYEILIRNSTNGDGEGSVYYSTIKEFIEASPDFEQKYALALVLKNNNQPIDLGVFLKHKNLTKNNVDKIYELFDSTLLKIGTIKQETKLHHELQRLVVLGFAHGLCEKAFSAFIDLKERGLSFDFSPLKDLMQQSEKALLIEFLQNKIKQPDIENNPVICICFFDIMEYLQDVISDAELKTLSPFFLQLLEHANLSALQTKPLLLRAAEAKLPKGREPTADEFQEMVEFLSKYGKQLKGEVLYSVLGDAITNGVRSLNFSKQPCDITEGASQTDSLLDDKMWNLLTKFLEFCTLDLKIYWNDVKLQEEEIWIAAVIARMEACFKDGDSSAPGDIQKLINFFQSQAENKMMTKCFLIIMNRFVETRHGIARDFIKSWKDRQLSSEEVSVYLKAIYRIPSSKDFDYRYPAFIWEELLGDPAFVTSYAVTEFINNMKTAESEIPLEHFNLCTHLVNKWIGCIEMDPKKYVSLTGDTLRVLNIQHEISLIHPDRVGENWIDVIPLFLRMYDILSISDVEGANDISIEQFNALKNMLIVANKGNMYKDQEKYFKDCKNFLERLYRSVEKEMQKESTERPYAEMFIDCTALFETTESSNSTNDSQPKWPGSFGETYQFYLNKRNEIKSKYHE